MTYSVTQRITSGKGHHIARLLLICIASLLSCLSQSALAQPANHLLVVFDSSKQHHTKLLERIRNRIPSTADTSIKVIELQKLNRTLLHEENPDLVLSVGPESSERLVGLQMQETPILHVLLPMSITRSLFPCLPHCGSDQSNHRVLILDQPIERQLHLIRLVLPEARHIGILSGSLSTAQQQRIQGIAEAFNLETDFETTAPRLLGSHIESLAKRVDLLFALADPEVYNPSTIPEILLTTYRHHVPVLGFSKGFVRAGAIAASVTSLDQFADQISRLIQQGNTSLSITRGVIYPDDFDVLTNRNVARSLNLRFPSDDRIKAQIKQHELAD